MSVVYNLETICPCIILFPSNRKNEMNVALHRVGAVTKHQSMDHNPSSPRVPRYDRGCLTVSWRLVFYEVYTKIERNALL
jgi:hypothetical protein